MEKDFFELMKNAVFGKTVENATKHRDMKLVQTDKRRVNRSIIMSILDISKTLMYEYWYDYINRNIKTKQNYVTQILTALLFIVKLKIFTKTLLMMLKNGLTHVTMVNVIKDRFQYLKTKK